MATTQLIAHLDAEQDSTAGLLVPGGGRWQWYVPLDADHRPIRASASPSVVDPRPAD